MAEKAPAYQWYPGDFRRDPRVIALTFPSRSVWRECLDAMFLDGNRGELSGTIEQLARICLCPVSAVEIFLSENKTLKVADVTICNGTVTLVNRRMNRAYLEREMTRKRVSKHRMKRDCNEDVTLPSSSSSSSSDIPTPTSVQKDAHMRDVTEPEKDSAGARFKAEAERRRIAAKIGKPIPQEIINEAGDETVTERRQG